MLPSPCAIVFSVTLTLLAAVAVLLCLDKDNKQRVPLWCLYDIDDPFDLSRSGRFCDIIVVCCLVDERGLDSIATLRTGLLRAGLSLPLLVMPWRDDWFWRRLCDDMVTKEFVNLFVESLSALDVAGVIHSETTECEEDASELEDRLLAMARGSKPLRIEMRDPNARKATFQGSHRRFASCRTSHALLWDPSVTEPQVCLFNVTRNISRARELRTELPRLTVVHTISAAWKLIHKCPACKDPERFSTRVKSPLCTTYAVRGSDSVYIRPRLRALLFWTRRLPGPFFVTNIAEDETAADSVGRPDSTILEQLFRILSRNFTKSSLV